MSSKETSSSKVFHVDAGKLQQQQQQQQRPVRRGPSGLVKGAVAVAVAGAGAGAPAGKATPRSKKEAKTQRRKRNGKGQGKEARCWPLREMVSLYSYFDSF